MPTGYTDDVQNGKIKDLETFVLKCAGAFIDMSSITEEFKPDQYYNKKLEEARQEYYDTEKWTLEDARLAQNESIERQIKVRQEIIKSKEFYRQCYLDMLIKVSEWQCPSNEYIELKKFMINQLKKSIEFDCGYGDYENSIIEILTPEEYKEKTLKKIFHDISFNAQKCSEEEERVKNKNEWIKGLLKSLEKRI